MSLILGIESTCDETAASVVEDGVRVRSNVIATQFELHAHYRGVVPEIASRAHIENILPVIQDALANAGCTLNDLGAIAVAHRPGLIGSLLIGVTAAKTLAWSIGKPLIGVDHVHAHLYSVMLSKDEGGRMKDENDASSSSLIPPPSSLFPAVGLVCSGGHTALYRVDDWTQVSLLGKTIDDAVGEAYDKVSAILGLGYPGGPIIDSLARQGDPTAIRFPRSKLGRESLNFSFSGLKTSVLYNVRGFQGKERDPSTLSDQERANVAASFQAACVDVLIDKINKAVRQIGAKSVIIGGGVSANRGLREALCRVHVPSFVPPMAFCTDNAAMIAGLGHVSMKSGVKTDLALDAVTMSAIR
jgi:N6-L-threonylcarbamoyladenine synthase